MQVQKTMVGGTMSEGMLCDSKMLGWMGGAEGIAVQIPESIPIGSPPPLTKPRPNQDNEGPTATTTTTTIAGETTGLYERKLTKEEKKKLAEEKRKAKRAAKEAKKQEDEEGN